MRIDHTVEENYCVLQGVRRVIKQIYMQTHVC